MSSAYASAPATSRSSIWKLWPERHSPLTRSSHAARAALAGRSRCRGCPPQPRADERSVLEVQCREMVLNLREVVIAELVLEHCEEAAKTGGVELVVMLIGDRTELP